MNGCLMNSPSDVVSFMIWLYRTGDMGDVYPLSDGSLIWKRAGTKSFYLCKEMDVFPIEFQ